MEHITTPLRIRHTQYTDLSQLQSIYAQARTFMAKTGNPTQWTNNYPSDDILKSDIKSNSSFVIEQGNDIVATFVLQAGDDPTYQTIYKGQWLNNKPYATIHRIASNGKVKGIFQFVVQYAQQLYNNLRIDTHHDNLIMQHAIRKAGFKYCGIIHTHNDSERLAYQWQANNAKADKQQQKF